MQIDFSELDFTFSKKPLLIGGKAMEYYGLRKAGSDIDLVVTKNDLTKLISLHPNSVKDLWGDLGVVVNEFEIWKSIGLFDYEYLSQHAIEESNYLVISLEKLLLQKALAMQKPKYHKDLELLSKRILDEQYKKFEEVVAENQSILSTLSEVSYIEKTGPSV